MGTGTPFLGVNSSGKINSTEELRRFSYSTLPQICLVCYLSHCLYKNLVLLVRLGDKVQYTNFEITTIKLGAMFVDES